MTLAQEQKLPTAKSGT